MKKMLLSIIIPILLLAILFFIFPDSHYLDYYLHYINTASDPLFDWFVIMMGGISANDISMLLIATLLIIYCFILFEKDEDRNTNVKLKHVVYGILGTAILMRIIYLCLFAINNSTCDEYKTINTQITDISDNKITVIVDSIPLSKSINSDDAKQAFIGDKIVINVGKGSLGYYCLGDEYKIIKSATKTTENIVDKTKEADSKAKSVNDTKTAEKATSVDKAPEQDINHRNYNIIDSIRKHLIEDIEEITKPDRKSYSLVLSFIVEGDSSKLIKDISIHKYPNDKIKRKVVDLIDQSEELRRLGNGIYLLNVHVYGGYIDEFKIKHIKTKEDYEILIAYYLHDKFPTLGNLRGSVFIDVTVSEDGNNEVKVSQSLHPEIDKMALNLAKNIPWHLSDVKSKRKGTKYRLTIMYAKGKLWQVKMWNMDY